jgi:hypothetical protein
VDARIYQLDFVGMVIADNSEGKGWRISSQWIGLRFFRKDDSGPRFSPESHGNRKRSTLEISDFRKRNGPVFEMID